MNRPVFPALSGSRSSLADWWREHVVATVPHRAVVDKVCEDAGWSAHYGFMTLMSAGIAILGLLLSSPAVVIGAMLISPLMGPIIGFGFALATFDSAEIRRTGVAILAGVALAIAFTALVVALSPLQTVTSEIAARTRPNLFDLLVALFSGLAGSYAMIRGRHGTIVGVAIATAIMPPLAVVGFGVATGNWQVFGGAALLFFTNLMTIAIAAAVLARLYGFAPDLSPRQTRMQAVGIVLTMAALALPLALALRQIAWEAVASAEARRVLAEAYGPEARISRLEVEHGTRPLAISATLFTPRTRNGEAAAAKRLETALGEPVALDLDQVVTVEGETEAAEIAAARRPEAEPPGTRLAERLALVAGVAPGDVLLDRVARRAQVRAALLPGATLASYRALETRVAAAAPGWTVVLVPPLGDLPDVQVTDGQPDTEALATVVWAARRLGLPVTVAGAGSEQVAEALAAAGVRAEAGPGAGPLRLDWASPSGTG